MPFEFSLESIKIFPLGNDALTIEFGNEISVDLNEKALNLARYLDSNRFQGFIETVPAYSSVSIFYDVLKVRQNFPEIPTAFEAISILIYKALENIESSAQTKPKTLNIPVNFSTEFALDLEYVATSNNISKRQVIEIFTSSTYRVFMIGFLPAFAYMGEIDERIAAPRKNTPRLIVPRGSVGIAGRQTGIYPFDSPGGWQIIGRTDFQLFTPEAETPSALQSGDLVKFYAVNE